MNINVSIFASRREHLARHMGKNAVAIIASAHEVARNSDAQFPFRQRSDFYYLTGFLEPAAVLLLVTDTEGALKTILFSRPNHPLEEQWNGARLGQKRAKAELGINEAFSIGEIDETILRFLADKERFYFIFGEDKYLYLQLHGWIQKIKQQHRHLGVNPPAMLMNLESPLHEMRLFKDDAELKLIQEAVEISAKAHISAMKRCAPGVMEYQLEAEILRCFYENGCRAPAYTTIVGGGSNACILHYTENQDQLKDGDLVLIDAGGEFGLYAADITRTFPVNGKFSPPQRDLYNLVLKAQLAGIAAVKPGARFLDIQAAIINIIVPGLVELGLLIGDIEVLKHEEAFKQFYMHSSGHWLGLDVHDVGAYKFGSNSRLLEPGMVLTVEPGLYIKPDCLTVDKKWRGVGIRIEDDVLVTKEGVRVLSAEVPKTIEEIEALMAK